MEKSVYLFMHHALLRHGDKNGVGIGARPPLIGRQCWHIGQCVRVEVLLEELRFSWHCKRNHLAEAVVVQPVKLGNLACRDVTASLGHHSDASLRVGRLESVDVVHKRGLRGDLKVPDHAVTLKKPQNSFKSIL